MNELVIVVVAGLNREVLCEGIAPGYSYLRSSVVLHNLVVAIADGLYARRIVLRKSIDINALVCGSQKGVEGITQSEVEREILVHIVIVLKEDAGLKDYKLLQNKNRRKLP